MTTARVCDPRVCDLGEGPFWHPLRQQLFWFDITGHLLRSVEDGQPRDWPMGECASAAGWIDRDTLLIATETGLYRFDLTTGERALVQPLEADNPVTRSNDGRTDPQGGFWIGTMGKKAEPQAGAIYRYYRGELRLLQDKISIPNSICFSPDGTTVYWTDTPTQIILKQHLDGDGWPVTEPEVFVDLRADDFRPDGSVTDSEGALWSAQWGSARVARYLPDGTFDRALSVGGRHSSCPVFGGPDLDRMFVTTACQGIASPDAAQGLLYEVDPGVRGWPDAPVLMDS
ncbi:L-arabinolactonase [Marinibacterium anthonyi]|nr:L-arabinolactonase [Marinibacterium anthonyi]